MPLCPLSIDREHFLTLWAENYQEAPAALGILRDGYVIELLASPDGGTFSLVQTRANGMSCLLLAGKNWQRLIPVRQGDPT